MRQHGTKALSAFDVYFIYYSSYWPIQSKIIQENQSMGIL